MGEREGAINSPQGRGKERMGLIGLMGRIKKRMVLIR
jgi:hypothetical protein